MTRGVRVATDVGGTFTDLVCLETDPDTDAQTVRTAKADTTPPRFERGVLDVLAQAGVDPAAVDAMAHGSTVVINALTERTGDRVGLITTRGFRDVLEIARGNRPAFFDLRYRKPPPFVPRHLRAEVPGRITHRGEEAEPLDLSGLPAILDDFRARGVRAVAVCLLHAYAEPAHERAVVAEVRRLWPEVAVVAGHRLTREWREYERTNTAVLCAYVQPVASRYLARLGDGLRAAGFRGRLYVMRSNGGVDTVDGARETPIATVESGPASGVWAAAELGQLIGEPNVLALDIGGTTAKCSLIEGGRVRITSDYWIERDRERAGYPVMVPVVDLVEIGNGGGSIAWVDEQGKLRVGPRSAGSAPGPAAYGRGGGEVTTTDANLALARINPDYFCGGAVRADLAALDAALSRLAARLGVAPAEAARGVVRIANANMANALKLVSVNRGRDPRDFTLVAFGGGGAMHAAALAEELGVERVVVPAGASVFSAWGMLMSDLRRDAVVTRLMPLDAEAPRALSALLDGIEAEERDRFGHEGIEAGRVRFGRFGRLRYQNQEHAVEVELPPAGAPLDAGSLAEAFGAAYEREYGYRLAAPVEAVGVRVVALADVGKLAPARKTATGRPLAAASKGRRRVDYDADGLHDAAIYDGALLEPGHAFPGPAVVEESGTTTVVWPGQNVRVDEYGNLHIATRCAAAPADPAETPAPAAPDARDPRSRPAVTRDLDPFTSEIIQNALAAAGDEMFLVLKKTAMSPIIYEVLDAGTGLTDADGELAASGCGIPTFVAVVDKAVKRVLDLHGGKAAIRPGDAFVTNCPYFGGVTHLNDVAILLPVFDGDALVGWTGNIAHWNDVGGMVAGSMSTEARGIHQEGLRLPAVKLFEGGRPVRAVFDILKANTRLPDFLEGDLWAGIAAARAGERRVLELIARYGRDAYLRALAEYMDYGERVSLRGLSELPHGRWEAEEVQEDGQTWRVAVEIAADGMVVDLRDMPDQSEGPYNLSRDGATIAAQLVFKAVTSPRTVCNGGALRPLRVLTRPGSLFEPLPPAPHGFYFETRIRLHDLLWRCLAPVVPGRLPAGGFSSICATVISGTHPDTGRHTTVVEPQVGGWGAARDGDGVSAQFSGVHGETYNCPAEVAEARYGVAVERLSLNDAPGGEGRFRGGKGIVAEYRIRGDARLTAGYSRSKNPPWGMEGGLPGSPNYVEVVRAADGATTRHAVVTAAPLAPGDLVRIVTGTGGGWGDPRQRPAEAVQADIRDGYTTPERAAEVRGG